MVSKWYMRLSGYRATMVLNTFRPSVCHRQKYKMFEVVLYPYGNAWKHAMLQRCTLNLDTEWMVPVIAIVIVYHLMTF